MDSNKCVANYNGTLVFGTNQIAVVIRYLLNIVGIIQLPAV